MEDRYEIDTYREYQRDVLVSWQKDEYKSILKQELLSSLTKINWIKGALRCRHFDPEARTVNKYQTDIEYIEGEISRVLMDIRTIKYEFEAIDSNYNPKRINKIIDFIKNNLKQTK